MDPATRPNIHIIAGPNGTGKTTFANRFLPKFVQCREFLNADLIAAGLSPDAPESQAVRASQLLLERIHNLVEQKQSFSFETTLAGRSYRYDGSRLPPQLAWRSTAEGAAHAIDDGLWESIQNSRREKQ